MIIFVIIFSLIFFILLFFAIKAEIEANYNAKRIHEELYRPRIAKQNYKSFSVSDYYQRMEKVYLDIVSERENKNDYKLTLWLGIDGLQLNDDGTTQWIKRVQKKKENKPTQDFCSQNTMQNIHSSQQNIQNVPPSQLPLNSIQNQMNCLNTQNYHLLQMQSSLNQHMINAIQQNHYLPYYPQMIYAQNLNQCFCNYSFYGCNNVSWL